MRRTVTIVSLLLAACFSLACGERSTTTTNAQSNASGTQGPSTGANAGSGPKTEGIGGASNGNAVNGNTYTVPPGFNENGDRGSASNVRNTP